MVGPTRTDIRKLLERITARRAELDELEEQLVELLADVRAERCEIGVDDPHRRSDRYPEAVAADCRRDAGQAPGAPGQATRRTGLPTLAGSGPGGVIGHGQPRLPGEAAAGR
ncbi:hypothetical protein [Streptomyces sp. 2132.2]|uniref:hypothetical protein n=1 Tax=Streptomyces sp. 2132.2 TaxID=2485161 RepID=UPI000F4A9CF4|nr:hypothetical protein [Streptomyces sp. 2132.2]